MGLKLNKNKTLFMVATSFYWFSLYAYIPELSTYAKELGASYKTIGVITGAYGFTQMLLRIPLGIWSDRLNNRKGFVILGIFITIISSLFTFINPSVFSLFVTRLLAGVAAATWVAFTVLFASYFEKEEATKSIGIINSVNAIGQLSAMIVGGVISYNFGTRYLYLLAAFGGTLSLVFAFTIKENKSINKDVMKLEDILVVASNKKLLIVSLLAILSQIITFATFFGFVPIIGRNLGANNFQLSMLTAIGILPAVIVPTIASTYLITIWGRKKTIVTGYLISSFLCIIIPFSPNLIILFIVQFISGVGRAMVFPLLMGIGIQDFDQHQRATAMGFFQAIYGVGMVLGPIILGFVSEQYNLVTGFFVTGIFGLIAIFITKKFFDDKESVVKI